MNSNGGNWILWSSEFANSTVYRTIYFEYLDGENYVVASTIENFKFVYASTNIQGGG